MNDLQIFQNEEFGQVRSIIIDDEPWFVGKDVANALNYKRAAKAISDHVDEEDRILIDVKTQSHFRIELGQRGGWVINESGLYSLILSSKLPSAKKFKRWVTSEVLPALRKTGSYSMVGKELSMADYIKLLDVVMNCDQERFEYVASILRSMGFGSKADHKQGRKQTSTKQHHVYASNTEGRQHVEDFLAGVEITNRPTNDVYEEYNAWCDHKNITPVSKIVFSKYVNAVLGTHVIQKKLNNVNRKIFAL